MSVPILYDKTTPLNIESFNNNGLGGLSDTISLKTTEESITGTSGVYELEMVYPIYGLHYDKITVESFIKAKANQTDNKQIFKIYYVSKPINGQITIRAEHISYLTIGIPVKPLDGRLADDDIMNALFVDDGFSVINQSLIDVPFNFSADSVGSGSFVSGFPTNLRSLLTKITEKFDGEYLYDNFDISLKRVRGSDKGYKIRYGKNMTDLNHETDLTDLYTGVYPYYYNSSNDNMVMLNDPLVDATTSLTHKKYITVDLTSEVDEKLENIENPTEIQIRTALLTVTNKYISTNNIGKINVSITVSFINLGDSPEYAQFKDLETVSIGDSVSIIFADLGVEATARVYKTVYDGLNERYQSIEIGTAKPKLAKTILKQGGL